MCPFKQRGGIFLAELDGTIIIVHLNNIISFSALSPAFRRCGCVSMFLLWVFLCLLSVCLQILTSCWKSWTATVREALPFFLRKIRSLNASPTTLTSLIMSEIWQFMWPMTLDCSDPQIWKTSCLSCQCFRSWGRSLSQTIQGAGCHGRSSLRSSVQHFSAPSTSSHWRMCPLDTFPTSHCCCYNCETVRSLTLHRCSYVYHEDALHKSGSTTLESLSIRDCDESSLRSIIAWVQTRGVRSLEFL